MGRVLSGLVLRHSKSESAQVKTDKQCFSLTEHNRGKCKVQGVDQVCLQILPYGGNAACDLDILVSRCLLR